MRPFCMRSDTYDSPSARRQPRSTTAKVCGSYTVTKRRGRPFFFLLRRVRFVAFAGNATHGRPATGRTRATSNRRSSVRRVNCIRALTQKTPDANAKEPSLVSTRERGGGRSQSLLIVSLGTFPFARRRQAAAHLRAGTSQLLLFGALFETRFGIFARIIRAAEPRSCNFGT